MFANMTRTFVGHLGNIQLFAGLCFNPTLLKIDIHVRFMMMHVKNIFFFKITIGSCKFMQLAILCK